MSKKICTAVFLFITATCFAQEKLLFKKNIPIKASFISTDNLGNIYAVAEGNLFKYNENGELVNSYSNKKLGRISSIDASNPLRVLVYVKDFAIVYVFDASLALQSSVKLLELNFTDPQLICSSNTASLWVYDRATTMLAKLNENLTMAAQSQPLNLTIKEELNPVMIQERDNWLVMLNRNDGFLIFNKEGSYFKKIPADSVSCFTMSDANLYFVKNGKIFSANIYSGLSDSGYADTAFEKAVDAHIRMGQLVVLYEDSVSVFDVVQK